MISTYFRAMSNLLSGALIWGILNIKSSKLVKDFDAKIEIWCFDMGNTKHKEL